MSKKIIILSLTALLISVGVSWLFMQPSPPIQPSPPPSTITKGTDLQPVNLQPVAPPEVDEVFVQIGHSSDVNSIAFSPDGQTALSGSDDQTVKWWDLATGRVIKTLIGHSDEVKSVAFSPDGKTALSGSEDSTVKWWNLATGRVIKTLKGHSDDVESVAFSPDGKTALSGSDDDTVKWWNLSTGSVIKTLVGHFAVVRSIAFSPDGKTALSGSSDDTVKWWDLSRGRVIKTLEGHSNSVFSVAFSPDGKTALSGGRDETVTWWDLSTGHIIKRLKGYSKSVDSVALSPSDPGINLAFYSPMSFSGIVYSVTFCPDGKTALSGSEDNTVRWWDLSRGRIINILAFKDYSPDSLPVACSPDGKTALSGIDDDDDSTVKWWDLSTGHVIKTLKKRHSEFIKFVAFSPDGKTALSKNKDHTLKWWDLATGRVLNTLEGHSGWVESVAFSPDGKTALSGSDDNTVKWWNLATGHVIKTLEGHSFSVYSVAFSPDGKTALSGSKNGTVKWWDLATGRVIKTLEGYSDNVYSVAFSPDGKTVLSGEDKSQDQLMFIDFLIAHYDKKNTTVKWWDLVTGRIINTLEGHSYPVFSVAFSPDGKTALSGSKDHTVKWWDLATGRVINTLKGHSSDVKSVAFSPDGQTALSGSSDGTVKWWNLSTGHVIKTLEGHSKGVYSVAFFPNGKLALSGSGDTIRLWYLQTGEKIIYMVGFDDGEGVAIMPKQGYYAASPKGEQYINVRVGNRSYGIDKYKAFYHRPDILKLALQLGDTQRTIVLANQPKTQLAQTTQETVVPSTPPQKRTALIIGNAAYEDNAWLKNPVNDANDLAKVLKKLNFDVIEKHNLNYAQMEEAILAFDEKLRQNADVGLFYFSGHGVQYQGTNYLIPVDGTRLLKNPKQLRYKAVAASYIQTTMEAAGSRVNLLILDACRSAPTFIKGLFKGEMTLPGLGYMVATSGSLIAYAASPGGVAVDGTGRNSPYVASLMNWIQKPHLSINQVLRGVRNDVVAKTNGKQSPGYYDELNEDFYFLR